MENKIAIREDVSHAIQLDKINVVVNSDQLKLLSLYLTFTINEPTIEYPYFLKTVSEQQVLFKRKTHGVKVFLCAFAPDPIISGYLSNDDMEDLSIMLEKYSCDTIHAPTLYDYTAYQNKAYAEEYGGCILKDEDNVVMSTPLAPNSTLLYVDHDREFIYGINGYTNASDGTLVPIRI
jgi:hypothetical protein